MNISTDIKQALIEPLAAGKLAVFSTDTVLGLGCAIKRPDLIKEICRLKERPLNQPIALLVSSIGAVEDLCQTRLSRDCRLMAENCWPGALTFLVEVPAKTRETDSEWWSLAAPTGYLGVRSPACPKLLAAIDSLGGAIMATSANLHSEPTPYRITDIAPSIMANVGGIWYDEGIKPSGQASTVVKTTADNFEIIREGFFSSKQLKALLSCDREQ